MPTRRQLLLAAPALCLAQHARAQTRAPVRLVVPFPAGGATDAVARVYQPALAAQLGGTVVIENRPGAGGVPAAEVVARAAPDGQTLLLTTSSTHSTGPVVNTMGVPYDPDRDFTPLAFLGAAPSLVLVSATVPVTDLRGFIAWARQRRGQVNYGSAGVGGSPHLTAALMDSLADLGMVHVPYRGTGAVYAEMRRGDVHLLLDVPSTAAPHLQSGAVKALAVTSERETPVAPGVPTAEAAGLPGLVSETWFGVYAPPRLSAEMGGRLSTAAVTAARDAEFAQRMLSLGIEPRPGDGAVLTRVAREERDRWRALVQRLGIRVE
jgi:tripartite-type tricarboxylate transporter receptor subunit TctC